MPICYVSHRTRQRHAGDWEMNVLLPRVGEHVTANTAKPDGNCLLAALAPAKLARLRPHLELVLLPQHQVLSEPYKPIEHAYFPQRGFISLVRPMADKSMIEVGIIGREGFVGSPVLLGANKSPIMAMVQAPGEALRIRVRVLLKEVAGSPQLSGLLFRYVQALHVQVAQTAACNGRHTLAERLARWLLTAHDRVAGDDLPLSHEFLAIMLGMRRSGVTVAVGALKKAGLIKNGHARITVLDRPGLEAAACECYRAVQDEYENLLT
jgi:CRP-like cAMP-binding protein